MDNAQVNYVMAQFLSKLLYELYGIHFSPDNQFIRCLAHVVNLIVQAILHFIDEADDPNIEDWFIPNKNLPYHYRVEDDEEQKTMEAEAEDAELEEQDELIPDANDADNDDMDQIEIKAAAKSSPVQKVTSPRVAFRT